MPLARAGVTVYCANVALSVSEGLLPYTVSAHLY
nr:MAG TPA: hypothetical protein [Caudoviricetes sp.]